MKELLEGVLVAVGKVQEEFKCEVEELKNETDAVKNL